MRDFVAGVIWFDVALLLGFVATVLTSERKERKPVTMRLVEPQAPQRDRIQAQEWHALDRKLAVARLKDELAPKVQRWKLKRLLTHLWRDLWSRPF